MVMSWRFLWCVVSETLIQSFEELNFVHGEFAWMTANSKTRKSYINHIHTYMKSLRCVGEWVHMPPWCSRPVGNLIWPGNWILKLICDNRTFMAMCAEICMFSLWLCSFSPETSSSRSPKKQTVLRLSTWPCNIGQLVQDVTPRPTEYSWPDWPQQHPRPHPITLVQENAGHRKLMDD